MDEKLITSIIVHYKRPENMKRVIEGIRNQTIHSKIIVWDNSGNCPKDLDIDTLIISTENFYCQPRFLIQGMVKTKFTYHQDDDLTITDKYLFEKFIEVNNKYPDYVIGANGRRFFSNMNWNTPYSNPDNNKTFVDVMDINDDYSLDMINTGITFLQTKLINQVMINPFLKFSELEYKYADDMIISSQLNKKRVMPFPLIETAYARLNEYEERQAALSKQSEHMIVRDSVTKKIWGNK